MRWGYLNWNLQRIYIKRPCDGYYIRWYYNGWHYWYFLEGKISFLTEGENFNIIGTKKIAISSGQITRSQCNAIRTIINSLEIEILTTSGWYNVRIDPGNVFIYDNRIDGIEIEFIAVIGSRATVQAVIPFGHEIITEDDLYILTEVGDYIIHE